MSLGRRKVGLEEQSRWVFNRMAGFYAARPAYPAELVDALADFGASRRAAMLEAGQPVTKPSERKPTSRKKIRTQ